VASPEVRKNWLTIARALAGEHATIVVMGWKSFLLATMVLGSCRSSSSPAHSQRIEVGYRDNRGVDRTKVLTVAIGTPVPLSPAPWTPALAESGCEGQEGRTLILTTNDNLRPADAGTVPHSNGVDYVATWTKDGRLWFTSDESPPSSTNRLFSYAPASHRQESLPVDNAILIRSARPL